MNKTVPNGQSDLQKASLLLSSAVRLVGKECTTKRPQRGNFDASQPLYAPDDLNAAFSGLQAAQLCIESADVPQSYQRFIDACATRIDEVMKALAPIRDLSQFQYGKSLSDCPFRSPEHMAIFDGSVLDVFSAGSRLSAGIATAVAQWRANFANDLLARSERLAAIAQASMDQASDPATMEKAQIVTKVVKRLGCRRNTAGNRVDSAISKGMLEVVSEDQYSVESVNAFLENLAPLRSRNTTIQVDDGDENFAIG